MKKTFSKLQSWVEVIQPWGILLAALALLATVVQLWWDLDERVQERSVRAWQLLTTPAPGNSGKIAALEYLNSEDSFFCHGWIKYTKERMFEGDHSNCLVVQKRREPLVGIDLSTVTDCDSVALFPDKSVFLEEINLQFANLTEADLNGVNLSDANLAHAEMMGASLCRADLSGADLTSADFSDANLRGTFLIDANLRGANLSGANLSQAYLWRTNLTNAYLISVNFSSARLSGANLTQTLLWSSDFIGADLSESNLSGADFRRANLSGANLSGADLTDAINLVQNQLDSACGDNLTILPKDDMHIKTCPYAR